jgi:hypothetical protein
VAELAALKVTELDPVVDGELKDAVTPAGSPVAARLTALLKPFCPTTVTVAPALVPPSKTLSAAAEEERLKPGAGMRSETAVLLLTVPDVPVTCTV